MRRAEYVDVFLDNVIPARAAKFSRRIQRGAIYIQYYNARKHVNEVDPLVSEAGCQLRLDLPVFCRLPLPGLYRAGNRLSSIYSDIAAVARRSYEELVDVV